MWWHRPLLAGEEQGDPEPRGWASPVGSLTRGLTSLLGGRPGGLGAGVGSLQVESDQDEEGAPRRWGARWTGR